MDQFTCEYFSKMGGTQTVQYMQKSTQNKPSPTFLDPGREEAAGTTYSTNTVARALIMPEKVRRLPPGGCLIFGAHQPVMAQLLTYYRDAPFAAQARPDPRYADTRAAVEAVSKQAQAAKMIPEITAAKDWLARQGYTVQWRAFAGKWGIRRGDFRLTVDSDAELISRVRVDVAKTL